MADDAPVKPTGTIYVVRLLAKPDAEHPERSIAQVLKRFGRQHGLHCVSIAPERPAPEKLDTVAVPGSTHRGSITKETDH